MLKLRMVSLSLLVLLLIAVPAVAFESFTILGTAGGTTSTTGTTPEASSIVLFGSGILAAAGIVRRKLS